MSIVQVRSRRKSSGGRYKNAFSKKKRNLGGQPVHTKLGKHQVGTLRVRGANIESFLPSAERANVYDPKTKKYSQVKIETILENPANRHFIRRNIITKGAVLKTPLGKARVTSRPGQEGTLNAILIE